MTVPVCGLVLYMYDGEYEGECILPDGHGGRHWDGLSSWETDEIGIIDYDSISGERPALETGDDS